MTLVAGGRRLGVAALSALIALTWAIPASAKRQSSTKVPEAPAESAPAASTPAETAPAVTPAPVPVAKPAEVAPAPAGTAPAEDLGRPESVEIQIRRLADRLADAFATRKGGGRYERWAVMPFSELGADVEKRKLGQVVAAQLEGSLQSDHGFICVERMKLNEVVKELQLGQTGLVDESKAPKVGKMTGADVLVIGSVGMLGDRYVVNTRAVSVEESRVLASAQVVINAAGLIAVSSDAVVLRTRSDAVFRSLLIPGWGQWYNRQEQKGTFIMVLSGGLLASGLTFYALGKSAEHSYTTISPSAPGACQGKADSAFAQCVQDQRATAISRYQIATGLFIGLGAVYAYNLLDAFLFGYSPSKRANSEAFGVALHPQGLTLHGSF